MIRLLRYSLLGLAISLGVVAAENVATLGERIRKSPLTSAKDGLFRQLAVEGVVSGQRTPALQFLSEFVGMGFRKDANRELNSQQLEMLAYAADASVFLALVDRYAKDVPFRRDVLDWLTQDEARYQLFLNTVSGDDDWRGMMAIITQLYDHDPKQRDEFLRLILALAVVWDQPRPPLHHQTGGKALPYEQDITARYDYFRDLYDAKRGEMSYNDLSVTALTFVVDLPVALGGTAMGAQERGPARLGQEVQRDRLLRPAARRQDLPVAQWPLHPGRHPGTRRYLRGPGLLRPRLRSGLGLAVPALRRRGPPRPPRLVRLHEGQEPLGDGGGTTPTTSTPPATPSTPRATSP